jgi:hypothetical protein
MSHQLIHELGVGKLGKSLTPSKCQFAEIQEMGSGGNCGRKAQFYEKGWPWRNPNAFRMFHKFSRINVKVIAELGFCARTFNPFQDIWDL